MKKTINIITLLSFLSWNVVFAAPEGGSLAQGSAAISQSGSTTTINQASQNAVINWTGFNTTSNEAVQFHQPNNSAIALNRINSGEPTSFAGSLSANGQVWIVNPNGILFTSTSSVNVAGLLATTHDITNSNFMSGNYKFDSVAGYENSKIINNGLISARDSGIVALVAPGVENNGIIQAYLGKVHLASGSAFVLDLNGDQLINFGSSPAVQNGYVKNTGRITANGGKVYMTAHSAAGVLDNVISMSGVIEAKSVSTSKGTIILNAGHAGKLKVSGKLDASGGGFIETSGSSVDLTGIDMTIGQGGTWLLDPTDVNIDAPAAALIVGQLNLGANVTIDTFAAGPDVGDLTVNAPIIQTSGTNNTLTLQASRDLIINQLISLNPGAPGFNGGKLSASAGRDLITNAILTASLQILLSAGRDVVLNGEVHDSTVGTGGLFSLNASRDVHINANILVDSVPSPAGLGWQFITSALGNIYINTPIIKGGNSRPGDFAATEIVLQQDVTFMGDRRGVFTESTFAGTLTGPFNATFIASPTSGFQDSLLFFRGDVNIKSLTVDGFITGFRTVGGVPQTIQTTGNQSYGTKHVTLENDLTMIAGGSIDVTGEGDVTHFDFSPFLVNTLGGGIRTPFVGSPLHNLTMISGTGITGSVEVLSLTLGGTGGANLSPGAVISLGTPPIPFFVDSGSFVGGQEDFHQSFSNTVLAPGATGTFCVNGFCTLIAPPNVIPNNIPPTQQFMLPMGLNYCDASGCSNVDMFIYDIPQTTSLVCLANVLDDDIAKHRGCVKLGSAK